MFALCDGEFIHSFTTASGVFCPAAMFSAAEVYETLFCFKTVDQLVPSGRWCENAVSQMDSAVGDLRQRLVVGDDDERLPQFVAQVEEELMQLGLVLAVEAS